MLWSAGTRLLGGVLGLTLLAPASAAGRRVLVTFVPQRGWRVAIPAAAIGTYLTLMLWLAGFKYGATTSAAVLNQTTTLFTVVLAAIFLGERFTLWHGLATALAFLRAPVLSVNCGFSPANRQQRPHAVVQEERHGPDQHRERERETDRERGSADADLGSDRASQVPVRSTAPSTAVLGMT